MKKSIDDGVDFINVARDRDRHCILMKTTLTLRGP